MEVPVNREQRRCIDKYNRRHADAAPLSYTVEHFLAVTGLNRKGFYSLVASGELRTFKVGRRRMISHDAAREFIAKRERETAEAEGR